MKKEKKVTLIEVSAQGNDLRVILARNKEAMIPVFCAFLESIAKHQDTLEAFNAAIMKVMDKVIDDMKKESLEEDHLMS